MISKKVHWFLVIGLVLALVTAVSCGGEDEPDPTSTSAPQATNTPVPATAVPPTDTPAAAEPTRPPITPTPTAIPTATSPPKIEGIFGGTINLQANNQPALDFLALGVFAAWIQVPPMYSQIVEYNPESEPLDDLRGDLAREWEVADDGITYTFYLNDNARFHDGEPVTSEDVVYSLALFIEPETLNDPRIIEEMGDRRSNTARSLKVYYDSSRAVDGSTIEIKTKRPSAAFMPILAIETTVVVVPKSQVEAGVFASYKDPSSMIGSGPFRMGEFVKDVSTQNIKNTDYFKEGRPYVDELRHFVITEEAAIVAAYKTENVMMSSSMVSNLSVKSTKQLVEESDGAITAYFGGPFWTTGTHMNARRAPFDDPRVRRAIHLAVHRQPIIQTFGGIHLLGTPVPPGYSWSFTAEEALQFPGIRELDGEKHPDDIAEAKRLLEAAGAGEGFKVEMTCYPVADGCDQAVLLQDQFRRFLGWDVEIRQIERAAAGAIYDAGEYDLASGFNSFQFPDADASGLAIRKGSRMADLQTGYYNEAAEPLWDQIAAELDPDRRKGLVGQVNELLMQDSTFVNSYFTMAGWIVNDRIKNFNAPASVSAQRKHEHLWCDPEC